MARKTSFYYAFLVLPEDQRRAIIAVWDFCRVLDDDVDEADVIGEGTTAAGTVPSARRSARDAVAFWREELARCYAGAPPETPQGRKLQPFIPMFDLPREAFEDVIDGVAMDVDTTRYQTFDDLLVYCRRVASAVGMICIKIFRCRAASAREYALNLGIALQLTNIIRDVKDDLERGRVYLPLDDLVTAGCTVSDLAAASAQGSTAGQTAKVSEPVRRLLAFQCDRARHFYQLAIAARPEEDRRRLVAAEIMRAVYFETLKRIEERDYDVFSSRTRVPKPMQALIAIRQWLTA